jgi:1,4-dihydroxy-2-naphthoate octaprenyltransferase
MATMTPVNTAAWWGAMGVGSLASAILVANNLRDIPTDLQTGKLTLAVRMGDRGSRWFYLGLIAVAFVMTGLASFTSPLALIAVLAAPLIHGPVHAIVSGLTGRALIPVLAGTGAFQLAWSALLGLGLALGRHFG